MYELLLALEMNVKRFKITKEIEQPKEGTEKRLISENF